MTPSEFKALYPRFEAVGDPTIQGHLNASVAYFDVDRWGALYTDGVGLFVAHRLVMGGLDSTFGTGSGSSTTKEIGDVKLTRSTSFTGKNSKDPYDLTIFGQQYKELRDQVGMGAVAV